MENNHEMLILVEAPQKGKSYEAKLSLVFFFKLLEEKTIIRSNFISRGGFGELFWDLGSTQGKHQINP